MSEQLTPPTYEDYQRYGSMWKLLEETGWIGYGEHACHVADPYPKVREAADYFWPPTENHVRIRKALKFEAYAHKQFGGKRNVSCSAGIADIVTDWAVVEVKSNATRESFFTAIGQVLIYRQAIGPLKAAIVFASTQDIDALRPIAEHAASIGVGSIILHKGEVYEW